jgi:hypothetical protein
LHHSGLSLLLLLLLWSNHSRSRLHRFWKHRIGDLRQSKVLLHTLHHIANQKLRSKQGNYWEGGKEKKKSRKERKKQQKPECFGVRVEQTEKGGRLEA